MFWFVGDCQCVTQFLKLYFTLNYHVLGLQKLKSKIKTIFLGFTLGFEKNKCAFQATNIKKDLTEVPGKLMRLDRP